MIRQWYIWRGRKLVSGVKQFRVAPSVPTPVHTTDAANKAYVDSAVGNVGQRIVCEYSGRHHDGAVDAAGEIRWRQNQSFHQALRGYGYSSEGGLRVRAVPTSELGSRDGEQHDLPARGIDLGRHAGRAAMQCRFRGVPVDTTSPSDNQVITYSVVAW